MKKILLLIVLILSSFSLIGCNNKQPEEPFHIRQYGPTVKEGYLDYDYQLFYFDYVALEFPDREFSMILNSDDLYGIAVYDSGILVITFKDAHTITYNKEFTMTFFDED